MRYDDDKEPGTAALAAVAGLARSVEALTRDVAAMKTGLQQTASKTAVASLSKTIDSLGDTVASFEDLLTRIATKPAARNTGHDANDVEPERSWLRLPEDDEAAVQAVLSELLPWLESTYLRYATARETLPPCWLWHPEIVEELLWLMDAWTSAYDSPEASNKLVGDWHDRQRPGVTRRIGEYAPACDVLAHRDTTEQRAVVVPLAADADPFVTWWATNRDTHGPAPTPEQIKAGRRGGLTAVPPTTAGAQR
ncbi:hypothetical protein E0H75_07210 [Kribbella capetownensis]|uniref:DUF4913 domain-containing protein n=1 Tax=Kribbella capetownensis TaxID=1572659 RepID=A0A4V6N4N7_9ACTN|nr:hypothetical protein [Kribbella capetownensis]TCC53472.1 hypothetical protein E0H75_07210 [Kribbella capetownensis]